MCTMSPLGLCIVGCGRFAGFHARAARGLPGLSVAFASRDPARAEAYRRRFRGVLAFGDYEAAAADSRIHALVVTTPHDLHRETLRLAVKHRKAVLLEKPIARTLDEADEMLAETDRAGVPFMVAENFHFMPAFAAARRLIAAGAIGRLRQVLISARGWRHPAGWRRRRAAVGGGVLVDGGVHYVHLLHDWGGPIAAVSAMAPANLFADVEGEDTAFVLVRFRSGAVGMLANSFAAPGVGRWQVSWATGTEGSLAVQNGGRWLRLHGPGGTRLRVFLRDRRGLRAQLRAFVAAVRDGAPPALSPRATRDDLAVVLAAYRAMETGTVVSFEAAAAPDGGAASPPAPA